jgi:hypothetical protein
VRDLFYFVVGHAVEDDLGAFLGLREGRVGVRGDMIFDGLGL